MKRVIANTALALFVAMLLAVVLFLTSCGTVKKTQTTHTEAKDSAQVKKDSSVQVKKTDITTVSTDSSRYKKTITIDLDTSPDTVPYTGSNPVTEKDYEETFANRRPNKIILDVFGPGPVSIDLGGHKPRKISITETGSATHYDSTAASHTDSTAAHSSDSTHTHTIIKDHSSSKRKTGMPFLLTTGITIAGLLLLWFWWKRRSK